MIREGEPGKDRPKMTASGARYFCPTAKIDPAIFSAAQRKPNHARCDQSEYAHPAGNARCPG